MCSVKFFVFVFKETFVLSCSIVSYSTVCVNRCISAFFRLFWKL
uniref:Uncharacterized protein n=1 Tax=Anguilla anguilla TaxID=7936 RepID=A0A0E9Y0U3_ANGAN